MNKIVIIVVILVVLGAIVGGLVYADIHAKELAEEHAEQKIAQTLPQVEGVHVALDGFPFTLGVLLNGEVKALHVKVDAVEETVEGKTLRATDLTLDVETISIDTDALLDEQRLVVTDIGRATAEGYLSDDDVAKAVGHEVEFSAGKARAEYKGKTIEATASVKGRLAMLSSNLPGVPPLIFPLPSSDLLPCSPELELVPGKMRLSCTVDGIPDKLKEAMAER